MKHNSDFRSLHVRLFTEEYDHFFDSISDAEQRSAGGQLLNEAALEIIERKRHALGIRPFQCKEQEDHAKITSYEWLELAWKEMTIEALVKKVELAERISSETNPTNSFSPDPGIKENQTTVPDADFGTRLNEVGFKILGELFSISPNQNQRNTFIEKMQRIFPKIEEEAIANAYEEALDRWTRAYTD